MITWRGRVPAGRAGGGAVFTMLDVLHLQMQARYEDANRLGAFPVQQFNNLEKTRNSQNQAFIDTKKRRFILRYTLGYYRNVMSLPFSRSKTCNYLSNESYSYQ